MGTTSILFLLVSALIFDTQGCSGTDEGEGEGECEAVDGVADPFLCSVFEVVSVGVLLTKLLMVFANPMALAQHMLGMINERPTFFLSHFESTGGEQCELTTYYSPPTFLLLTIYYLLLTTYYLLPTAYYLLLTYHLPLTAYYLLLTSYFLLLTTYYQLPTTYYLLLTNY